MRKKVFLKVMALFLASFNLAFVNCVVPFCGCGNSVYAENITIDQVRDIWANKVCENLKRIYNGEFDAGNYQNLINTIRRGANIVLDYILGYDSNTNNSLIGFISSCFLELGVCVGSISELPNEAKEIIVSFRDALVSEGFDVPQLSFLDINFDENGHI